MKIITFEGPPASGKTTQNELLCKSLNLQPATFYNWFHGMFKDYVRGYIGEDIFLINHETSMKTSQIAHAICQIRLFVGAHKAGWFRDNECVVVDHFHECLTDLIYADVDTRRRGIQFFRDGLLLDGGVEPVASFYLATPHAERVGRSMYRRYDRGFDSIEDTRGLIKESPEDIAVDSNYNEIYQFLADEIPYFYFIDGTRSPDEIHSEVLGIVKENL